MEMVRKQVYITKEDDDLIKQEAYIQAVPETEVVRNALEYYFRRSLENLSPEELQKICEAPIVAMLQGKTRIEESLRKVVKLLSQNKTDESLEIIAELTRRLEAEKREVASKKKELLSSFIGVFGETDLPRDLARNHEKYLYGRRRR